MRADYAKVRRKLWSLRHLEPKVVALSRLFSKAALLQSKEVVYQNLFHAALARHGIPDAFYPVGGAANYSLLYLLLRMIEELPVRTVLELGCGQTTLLLDRLDRDRRLEVVSLEHDHEWSERIGSQVKHEVRHAPLLERTIHGRRAEAYDSDVATSGRKFDLVLVDGPKGARSYSRWGCLEMLESCLGDDFIVVFDDAERRGELDTIGAALELLAGKDPGATMTRAANSQLVVAAGRFLPALHF